MLMEEIYLNFKSQLYIIKYFLLHGEHTPRVMPCCENQNQSILLESRRFKRLIQRAGPTLQKIETNKSTKLSKENSVRIYGLTTCI